MYSQHKAACNSLKDLLAIHSFLELDRKKCKHRARFGGLCITDPVVFFSFHLAILPTWIFQLKKKQVYVDKMEKRCSRLLYSSRLHVASSWSTVSRPTGKENWNPSNPAGMDSFQKVRWLLIVHLSDSVWHEKQKYNLVPPGLTPERLSIVKT